MTESACHYLTCETTTFRESLDLSKEARVTVVLTWYCRHPFHGIRLELGDEFCAVERRCAACALPRPEPNGGAD
jgi:hypothetical protein